MEREKEKGLNGNYTAGRAAAGEAGRAALRRFSMVSRCRHHRLHHRGAAADHDSDLRLVVAMMWSVAIAIFAGNGYMIQQTGKPSTFVLPMPGGAPQPTQPQP
jgi:hypothetical protein